MSNGKLVTIQFDPATFLSSMVRQVFEHNENYAVWEIEEPHPVISHMPEGDYSLFFSLPEVNKEPVLSIALLNEQGLAVKVKQVPLTPMFSSFADGVLLMDLDAPLQGTEKMNAGKAAPEILSFLSGGLSPEVSQKRSVDQSYLFKQVLGEFCDFGEAHQSLLVQLHSTIIMDASILIVTSRDRQFEGNFVPPKKTRH